MYHGIYKDALDTSEDTDVDGHDTWLDALDTDEDDHYPRRCLKWPRYLPLFVVSDVNIQLGAVQ